MYMYINVCVYMYARVCVVFLFSVCSQQVALTGSLLGVQTSGRQFAAHDLPCKFTLVSNWSRGFSCEGVVPPPFARPPALDVYNNVLSVLSAAPRLHSESVRV